MAVAWNTVTDCGLPAAGYRLLRNGVEIGSATTTTLYDPGVVTLPTGSFVSYAVQAVDAAGNRSVASVGQSTALPDVAPPSTPGGLKVAVLARAPVVTWDASTDASSVRYALYRDGIQVALTSDRTFADGPLVEGSQPGYQVVAVDLDNNISPPTAVVLAALPAGTPPGKRPPPAGPSRTGRFQLSGKAQVLVHVLRPGTRRAFAAIRFYGKAGANTFSLPARTRERIKIPVGTYQVCVRVVSGSGRLTSPAAFRMRR